MWGQKASVERLAGKSRRQICEWLVTVGVEFSGTRHASEPFQGPDRYNHTAVRLPAQEVYQE